MRQPLKLKEKAKESFIKVLTKAIKAENKDITLETLTDRELKDLYLKLQFVQRGGGNYKMIKNRDFRECLEQGKLAFVTFRGTPGVRNMTFKEYLEFEKFVALNPHMYKLYN